MRYKRVGESIIHPITLIKSHSEHHKESSSSRCSKNGKRDSNDKLIYSHNYRSNHHHHHYSSLVPSSGSGQEKSLEQSQVYGDMSVRCINVYPYQVRRSPLAKHVLDTRLSRYFYLHKNKPKQP